MKLWHRGCHLLKQERGAVTIEAALSMFSLVVVTTIVVGILATMGAKLAAIQMASSAARAHAVGVAYEPAAGDIMLEQNSGVLTVTARVPAVLGEASATALAPVEVAP